MDRVGSLPKSPGFRTREPVSKTWDAFGQSKGTAKMRRKLTSYVAAAAIALGVGTLAGQAPPAGKSLPPQQFDAALVGKFFPDIRSAVGPGQPGGQVVAGSTPGGGTPGSTPMGGGNDSGGGAGWKDIISAETLENEIKNGVLNVADTVSSPGKFNTGHRLTRKIYSVISVCFAVIAQYDGDVRFKDKAAGMRELVGRSGFNCKVATTGAHNEAKLRFEDLQSLTRGATVDVPEAETVVPFNEQVANRPPLMQRMDDALDRGLKPLSANKAEFDANKDKLLHEAEILRMLAKVIQETSYEYAEDESYLEPAKAIEQQCSEIVNGLKTGNLDQVQAAVGEINKACSACHELFRG